MSQKKWQLSAMLCILICIVPLVARNNLMRVDAQDFNQDYVAVIYDEKNGAYSSSVNDIMQASDGTIYIASSVGLITYDGRQFRREYTSLTSEVNVVYQDALSRIWIGTNDSGLIVLDGDQQLIFDKMNGFDSNSVRKIISDGRMGIYVATTGGLYYFNRNLDMKLMEDSKSIYTVSIAALPNGLIAGINNSGEVYFIDGGKFRTGLEKTISGEICTGVDAFGEQFVFSTFNGTLIFVDYKDGFLRKNDINIAELSGIRKIYDENGKCWILADNGIGYLENEKFVPLNFDNYTGYYEDMFCDFEGNYWIASSKYGILKLAANDFRYISAASGGTASSVNATLSYHGQVFVGRDSGLEIRNSNTFELITNELTQMLAGVKITGIEECNGKIWIATYGEQKGLICYQNGKAESYDRPSGMISNSYELIRKLSDGSIVAITRSDIIFIRDDGIKEHYARKEELATASILDAVLLANGKLMFASDGQGIILWENGEIQQKITMEDGLSSDMVRRIVPYSEGYIVVTGNALCYMKDQKVRRLGLSYSGMYDVIQGMGEELWILSNSGLFLVNGNDLLSKSEVPYELYNYERGFQNSLTMNSWSDVDEQGNVFLCCQDGIVIKSLLDTGAKDISYHIAIKSVYFNDEKIEYNSGVELPSTTGRLVICPSFTKFSYEKMFVSYYLEGHDGKVIQVESKELPTEIVYSNLPGGEYVFHMELLRNGGREVIDSIELQIDKKIAWYENTLIRTVIAVLVTLLVFLGVHIFIRTQLEKAEKKKNEYRTITKQTIMAIAKTIDAKDEYTNGHSVRVANYSMEIAKRYGMKTQQQEDIYYCGLLHDIGKIGIPDEILNKTTRLTDEEFEIIKSHPTKGAEILKEVTTIPHLVEGAKYHHEKFDGTGYNEGLIGKQIPLFARIIAVADTFDAMTTSRCYRDGLDVNYVKEELKRVSGKQLDPVFVNIMLEMVNDGWIDLKAL